MNSKSAHPPIAVLSAVFIFIWASGYVVAKLGVPYAPPLTFLSIRCILVVVVMGLAAHFMHAPWPVGARAKWHVAIAGVLMQAGYLGGVWCAIKLGMPAGVAAIIVNTQPILTAFASRSVGEHVQARQWLGLVVGFAGVAMVLANKITLIGLSPLSIGLCLFALACMTIGTLYQKRFCANVDVRTGQVLQFAASAIVLLPLAWWFEDMQVVMAPNFVIAMTWSVLVLSVVGISVLFTLIRHGAATRVTSLMYLVPPVTALMAWLMFGEAFSPLALLGMALTAGGVALVVRSK